MMNDIRIHENITVSMPLADFVQIYNALDLLLEDDDIDRCDPIVVDLARSRRDECKARMADGMHIDFRGA